MKLLVLCLCLAGVAASPKPSSVEPLRIYTLPLLPPSAHKVRLSKDVLNNLKMLADDAGVIYNISDIASSARELLKLVAKFNQKNSLHLALPFNLLRSQILKLHDYNPRDIEYSVALAGADIIYNVLSSQLSELERNPFDNAYLIARLLAKV
uniref:Ribophorin-2 n=1 Tax=Bursaphelenchus xylophilus TaxID=6326 RepID=A0A1I7SIL3_BURXY